MSIVDKFFIRVAFAANQLNKGVIFDAQFHGKFIDLVGADDFTLFLEPLTFCQKAISG